MPRKNHSQQAQARIDHIQALYREWTELWPRLQAEQHNWQRSMQLMRELMAFYSGGEFRQLHEAIENGWPARLDTPGEHSVMAEDTLWNALHDHRQLAWQRLRTAVSALDTESPEN